MRQFLLGLLSGLVLAYMIVPLMALLVWFASRGQPDIPSDSALVVRLRGDIPEHVGTELPGILSGFEDEPLVTLYGLTEIIRRAAADEDIRALVLRSSGSGSGWAKAQELRWAIQEFKESGKPVWAFLEIASRADYYVASLADHVVIQPESFLDLKGLRMEVMFFKGALDKLGIAAELVRAGKYKGAGEPYSRDEMSEELREVLDETLDEFYRQLLGGITEARGLDAAHWRGILDEGPFTSEDAKRHGLVDDILHEDAFFAGLSETAEVESIHQLRAGTYAKRVLPSLGKGRKIAVMHAIGAITSGSSWTDPLSGSQEVLGSRTFIAQLDKLRQDERLAGVILRIDSPGGEAIASEQMLRAVRRLSEDKPLVVSMSNVAASGGYYIASAPNVPILAYPGTYTGSIGVFLIHLNLRGLYDKLGINKEILSRGRYAAIDSDYKTLSQAEKERLRDFVDSIYVTFLNRVSEGRDVTVESLHDLAQGRVWVGSQALENGLIDELGGYQRAIELVKEAAGIAADEQIQIVNYPPPRTLAQALFGRGARASAGQLLEAPVLEELRRAWKSTLGWAAWLRGGAMHLMPYALSVD